MDNREFRNVSYHRTYYWSSLIEGVLHNHFAYLRNLESLFGERGILRFCEPYSRDTALHQFARFCIDETFHEDLGASSVELWQAPTGDEAGDYRDPDKVLPVEAALLDLGIDYGRTSCELLRDAGSYSSRQPDTNLRFYENFWEDLYPSEAYGQLLCDLAEDVFFIMFLNRSALAALNEMAAVYLKNYDYEPEVEGLGIGLVKHEAKDHTVTRLERRKPPVWARNAVRYRDRDHCGSCGREMGMRWNRDDPSHFDHIVPLARGGLNDVTNLQLLCQSCNLEAGSQPKTPRENHQRWYPIA